MQDMISGPETRAMIRATLAPRAEITFEVPYTDGGTVGDMTGPWVGPDGFFDGWAEWLSLWSEFTFSDPELVDVGDGTFLLLVMCRGRMRAGGGEIRQEAGAVYTVRDGQIQGIRQFLDQSQARQAAGLT